jgi:hypothetical protein
MGDSLKAIDEAAASVAVAQRVALSQIESKIKRKVVRTADHLFDEPSSAPPSFGLLTICILEMQNGYTIIGKSAPAAPENFDRELGETLAYEDAVRQVWPLEGYLLREQLNARTQEIT